MKIFVCIKQVPDTETKVKVAGDGSSLDVTGIKWVMNPYDEFAVEESIKIREANPGSQIFVVTAGPKARAGEVLRTALAMGADEGILVDLENADSFMTAKALGEVLKKEGGASLVLAGKLAIDDNQSSVPQMIAEHMGFPHVSVVSKLTIQGESCLAERDVEGGAKEIVKVVLPAVVSANKGLNMPRYASLPGIMKAKKKVLKEYAAADLGLAGETKVKTLSMELPADKSAVKIISGDSSQQVSSLVQLLRDEAKVL